MRLFTKTALLSLFLVAFVAAPLAAYAADQSASTQEMQHMGFWDKLGKELGLNANQQGLLENVKNAARTFVKAEHDAYQKTHDIFVKDCEQAAPNFDASAQQAKALYHEVLVAHDALTDAKVAFYKTLTPQQRAKVVAIGMKVKPTK